MADHRQGRPNAAKSREETRRESRQALEKKKHRRHTALVIGLVAAIVLAAVILSLTVFFKITAVEVDASKTQYEAAQIREASGITEGDNLFLMDREAVAEQISQKLPYTGEITVKRSLPTKVRITVTDSKIKAAVRYDDQYIVLNEENKVLAKVGSITRLNELVEKQEKIAKQLKKTGQTTKKPQSTTAKEDGDNSSSTTSTTAAATTTTTTVTSTSEDASNPATDIAGGEDLSTATDKVTILSGIDVKSAKVGYILQAKDDEIFETYNRIMEAMASRGIEDITAVDLTKVSDIRLTYQKRITILLGSASSLDRKAALCAKVLEEQNKVSTEQKGTIDLSIEGKAYFSESGATTRTTTTAVSTEAPLDVNSTVSVSEVSETGETTTVSGTSGLLEPSSTTTSTTMDPADTGG